METLKHLIPNGGWTIHGDDFDTIIYDEGVTPITKKQFDDTIKIIEKIKKTQDETKESAKAAILDRIGLTADELKTILG